MALQRDFKYYRTRLDYVKFLWIHATTWAAVIILSLLVTPFYSLGGPWTADIYTQHFVETPDIVVPKVIEAQEYKIGDTQVIDLVNGQKILFTSINNKVNPNVGFSPWVYTYQVLDSGGKVLEQKTRNSEFLLPNEQTYIVVYTADSRAAQLRVQPDDVNSVLVPHNPESPNFLQQPAVSQQQATLTENPDGESFKVYLLLKNEDRLDVERLDYVYILRDRSGEVMGINSSFLTGFWAGTERESVILSQPKAVDQPAGTPILEVLTRINYLDPEVVKLR